MNPWDVLGIEPVADRRAIKRAYAKKIRHHRPDEDQAHFDTIRSAYEWIISSLEEDNSAPISDDNLSHSMAPHADSATSQPMVECRETETTTGSGADRVTGLRSEREGPDEHSVADQFDQFLGDFDDMLAPLPAHGRFSAQQLRDCRDHAIKLLARPIANRLDTRDSLSYAIIQRFGSYLDLKPGVLSTSINLPVPLIKLFGDHFLWIQDEIRLYSTLGEERVGLVFFALYQETETNWADANIDPGTAGEARWLFRLAINRSKELIKQLGIALVSAAIVWQIPLTAIALWRYWDDPRSVINGLVIAGCLVAGRFWFDCLRNRLFDEYQAQFRTHALYGTCVYTSHLVLTMLVRDLPLTHSLTWATSLVLGLWAIRNLIANR